MFIVNFNDDAYLDQPFTSDSKKLEEALDKIDSKGGTAMRDAISMSIDYLKDKGKKDKKVLLVVTDGNDNTSNESLEQLVRKARQTEVLIYCDRPAERRRAARSEESQARAEGAGRGFRRHGLLSRRTCPRSTRSRRRWRMRSAISTFWRICRPMRTWTARSARST